MTQANPIGFEQAGLQAALDALSATQLDELDFGVIGVDADGAVQRYNSYESLAAGLAVSDVVGRPLFGTIAPCMNNFMIAQRFADAAATGQALDESLKYVLTFRMRPTPVLLRLLADPVRAIRYVCVQRRT
jgi:photoactive yellow protein